MTALRHGERGWNGGRPEAPHTRVGPQRRTLGLERGYRHPGPRQPSDLAELWHTTRPRPWALKARRRRRNAIARASRKANR